MNKPQLISYSFIGTALAGLSIPVYIYVPSFYATEMGLGLATAGFILLLARLFDAITDPLIGWLSDKYLPQFSRKFFVLAGVPLSLLGVWLLLLPPAGVGALYLFATSCLLYLGWTLMNIPHAALGVDLSPSYHSRARLNSWREGFLLLGTLLALTIPVIIHGTGASVAQNQSALAYTLLPLLALGALLFWLGVPTPVRPTTAPTKLGWRVGLSALQRNIPFRQLLGSYFMNALANSIPPTLFVMFVAEVIQQPQLTGAYLLVYFAAGLASLPFWLWRVKTQDKHVLWRRAMLLACLCFLPVPLLGAESAPWFFAICVLTGFMLGADLILPPAMQADVIAADEAKTNARRAGLYMALWSMATKAALALGVGIVFPLLAWVGQAPLHIALLYSWLPIVLKILAIMTLKNYALTRHKVDQIGKEQ